MISRRRVIGGAVGVAVGATVRSAAAKSFAIPAAERELWRWWMSDAYTRREAPEGWYFDTHLHNEIVRDHEAEAASLSQWPIYRATGRRSVDYERDGEIVRGPWRTPAEIAEAVRRG